MKITKLTVFLAILIIFIMAIGTVSAESYDGSICTDENVNAISTASTYTVNEDTYSDYFDDNKLITSDEVEQFDN